MRVRLSYVLQVTHRAGEPLNSALAWNLGLPVRAQAGSFVSLVFLGE